MGGLPKEIAECPLCTAIATEKSLKLIPIESDGFTYTVFYILPTKDKKGHSHRYMVVSESHSPDNTGLEGDAIAALFLFMREFGRDFVILEPTNATVTSHWHRVSSCICDSGTDQALIEQTERIEIRFARPQRIQ